MLISMDKSTLVMGGTRFFGKRLVERLLQAGHRVTIATRGRAGDEFGERVRRIRVDRRDARAMAAAFSASAGYDIVHDQVCYSPLDAAISIQVFKGRVQRYVMASTIEVYDHLGGRLDRPFVEDDIDPGREPIDMDYPWHAPDLADEHYGRGKRQAEALFLRDGSLPVVSVRIAHVLAGPEDFTGRLASYVDRVLARQPLRHSPAAGESSFIDAAGIADFLAWVGAGDFLGPVNAASDGTLSAPEIHSLAAHTLHLPSGLLAATGNAGPSELSPFDYPTPYSMDTRRARSLGYRFGRCDTWLGPLILQHAAARRA